MELRKALLFAAILILPALLAGCNVRDWYNQEGYVTVELAIVKGDQSFTDGFQRIKAQVFGVTLRQADVADTKQFTFSPDPLIVDLVGQRGENIPLAAFRTNLRATERVAVHIRVFEAIDAAGNPMPLCGPDQKIEKFPCFYQEPQGRLVYGTKQFSPPRGGQVIVGFPVAIRYATQGAKGEYFMYADPALVSLTVDR